MKLIHKLFKNFSGIGLVFFLLFAVYGFAVGGRAIFSEKEKAKWDELRARLPDKLSLSGIDAFSINVKLVMKGFPDTNVSEQWIYDRALVAVKAKLPKIKILNEKDVKPGIPYIELSFVIVKTNGGYAGMQDASFRILDHYALYPSSYSPKDTRLAYICLWESGGVFSGPDEHLENRIEDQINDSVMTFAANYYKDNP